MTTSSRSDTILGMKKGSTRLKALDLFCCGGGASAGLVAAGFDVVGVDLEPQPDYPYEFVQGDALAFPTDGFDFVWASPPCQGFTAYKRRKGHVKPRPNLIPATRAKLKASRLPYVIENVVGAPLDNPIMLCGSSFGLDVRRHRLFETSYPVAPPPCDHKWQTPRFPPGDESNEPSAHGRGRRMAHPDRDATTGYGYRLAAVAETLASDTTGVREVPRGAVARIHLTGFGAGRLGGDDRHRSRMAAA